MATLTEKAASAAADPEARTVWLIVVAAVAVLVIISRAFRTR